VEFVDGMVVDRGDVRFRDETITVSVQGFTADIIREFSIIKVSEGRLFSSGESKVAMVGDKVARDLFDREMKIGDIIQIEGETFRVVGILQPGSGATASIFDQSVSIPRSDAERLFLPAGSKKVSAIILKVSDGADIDKVAEDVKRRLRASHKKIAGEEDFTVGSSKTIQKSVGQISAAITVFLGGIAGISLLVGAIGIVNTMFMSVMERTKQIGILKAVGAKSREIMAIFLVESSLLGLVGGVLGTLIGLSFAMVIPLFTVGSGFGAFTPAVTPELVIFCIGFSTIVGALSGLLPARRAAKMQPVEALRYE
jgi:putative ABC transport system permease protein